MKNYTILMVKERVQISFNQNQIKQLKKESEKRGESVANIVRTAVNDFFLKHEVSQ